jgi:hypothetical protein
MLIFDTLLLLYKVWQGDDSLKFHPGLLCPSLLHPAGWPTPKQPDGRFGGGLLAGQVACGCLRPFWTLHAVRLWILLNTSSFSLVIILFSRFESAFKMSKLNTNHINRGVKSVSENLSLCLRESEETVKRLRSIKKDLEISRSTFEAEAERTFKEISTIDVEIGKS